jgi:hypothetical protein
MSFEIPKMLAFRG